jgi:hypothetical protein
MQARDDAFGISDSRTLVEARGNLRLKFEFLYLTLETRLDKRDML